MYVRELNVRYRMRRMAGPPLPADALTSPRIAASLLTRLLGHEIVEVCGLLCLTTDLRLIAYHELARGTLDHAILHARDVYRTALLAHAASVVIGHNHPSGNPAPSPDDVALATRLSAAGALVGIPLADHVIVTTGGPYFSFKESGQL